MNIRQPDSSERHKEISSRRSTFSLGDTQPVSRLCGKFPHVAQQERVNLGQRYKVFEGRSKIHIKAFCCRKYRNHIEKPEAQCDKPGRSATVVHSSSTRVVQSAYRLLICMRTVVSLVRNSKNHNHAGCCGINRRGKGRVYKE